MKFSNKEWKSKEEMRKEAKRICDKYLGTDDKEIVINVNDYMRASIISSLKKCSKNIFDMILKDVEFLLRTKFIQYENE